MSGFQFENPLKNLETKRIALVAAIFFVVFTVYVLCPVATSTDSRWTPYIAMSMLREGNADLDEYAHLMEDRDYRVIYRDGHIYSYFPLSVPLISTPYFWVVDQYFTLRYSTDFSTYLMNHFPDETTARYEMIAASFVSALAVMIFFLVLSRRLKLPRALLLTFILAFSTPMLSTASRALWQHCFSAIFLTSALWIFLERVRSQHWIFLAGFLLGLSYVIRPTNSISIIFFSMYLLVNHRKQIFAFGFGLFPPVIVLVIHSWQTYQTLLPSYYQPQRLGTNPHFLEALFANLISPNRGLFLVSPILIFSVAGIFLLARAGRLSLRKIELYLVAILILHWIAISSFGNWYGGWSLGPRFFTDMMPYFVFLLVPVFEDGKILKTRAWQIVFGFLLFFSTMVHFRYATSVFPMMWNGKPTAIVQAPERVWDMSDLQLLRGFCDDKLEGRAPHCWLNNEMEGD